MSQYIRYPEDNGGGSSITVSDTNSIDLSLAGAVLSADLRISSNAADANNLVIALDVESTGVVGLRAQVPFSGIRGLFSATTPALYNSSTGVSSIQVANTSQNGYLTSTDWNTFNGKQAAGNYITALTGDATASGPGSVALTLATVNPNVGTFGTAAHTNVFAVNGKGLITGLVELNIQIAESQVTNLVSDLAGKQATGNYITALSGDVVAAGPGSAAATIQTGVVTAAKIANLTITNAQVSSTAGLSVTKFQALTANTAAVYDAGGHLASSATTDTEIGFVHGVTSAIQTQINSSIMTSEVFVDTGNGYGSSSTFVRRFTNIRKNTGSDITYADSATLGGTFTIVTSGVYTMNYTDYNTGGSTFLAPTVDAANASVSTLTYATGRRLGTNTSGTGTVYSTSWTGILTAGQVVRAMTDGNANSTDAFCAFSIVKVSR